MYCFRPRSSRPVACRWPRGSRQIQTSVHAGGMASASMRRRCRDETRGRPSGNRNAKPGRRQPAGFPAVRRSRRSDSRRGRVPGSPSRCNCREVSPRRASVDSAGASAPDQPGKRRIASTLRESSPPRSGQRGADSGDLGGAARSQTAHSAIVSNRASSFSISAGFTRW